MSLLESSNEYWEFLGQCTQCGHCTQACESLTTANMTLGDIAKSLLDAQRDAGSSDELAIKLAANEQLTQAVRGCFFCTTCKNTCFAHNDVSTLIYHARDDYQKLGLIPRDTYASVEVDKEWDIFTAYRAIYGIDLTDLTRHIKTETHDAATDCEVAFFPGCSLAAYAPDLTREIFETLDELGGKATMIDHCCGSPQERWLLRPRRGTLRPQLRRDRLFGGSHARLRLPRLQKRHAGRPRPQRHGRACREPLSVPSGARLHTQAPASRGELLHVQGMSGSRRQLS